MNLLNSSVFKTGFTAVTLGLGGVLFWFDIKTWVLPKKDENGEEKVPVAVFDVLLTGSLFDNGIGLAWSLKKNNDKTWKYHGGSYLL